MRFSLVTRAVTQTEAEVIFVLERAEAPGDVELANGACRLDAFPALDAAVTERQKESVTGSLV